ncbi:hypothetical protein G7K_0571-t1 [Saitoella complicata NRRL Y-17804]|uniref:Uncharacterized protein n=2 Tax=Saitoella complicata (strain BCRC 22490 / CBS 7301 / JCM 7358 / NBRC 10748 / NRRL Y-17804) TaxID=698492 RepID=A0A0E9N932_SAICN|nr:hypothetical protein G7K_0571-t1 [Saitoella complicata NRRL Y-17804]
MSFTLPVQDPVHRWQLYARYCNWCMLVQLSATPTQRAKHHYSLPYARSIFHWTVTVVFSVRHSLIIILQSVLGWVGLCADAVEHLHGAVIFANALVAQTEKWSTIATYLPGRTNKSCRKRWFHSLDPKLKRGAWTEAEDQLLREGVARFGTQWSRIAATIEGRTDDQCSKRYREGISPSIDKLSPWSPDDDLRLGELVRQLGTVWQKIAPHFQGRTGLQCRNRWRKINRETMAVKNVQSPNQEEPPAFSPRDFETQQSLPVQHQIETAYDYMSYNSTTVFGSPNEFIPANDGSVMHHIQQPHEHASVDTQLQQLQGGQQAAFTDPQLMTQQAQGAMYNEFSPPIQQQYGHDARQTSELPQFPGYASLDNTTYPFDQQFPSYNVAEDGNAYRPSESPGDYLISGSQLPNQASVQPSPGPFQQMSISDMGPSLSDLPMSMTAGAPAPVTLRSTPMTTNTSNASGYHDLVAAHAHQSVLPSDMQSTPHQDQALNLNDGSLPLPDSLLQDNLTYKGHHTFENVSLEEPISAFGSTHNGQLCGSADNVLFDHPITNGRETMAAAASAEKSKSVLPYSCNVCPPYTAVFQTGAELLDHVRSHPKTPETNTRPFRCALPGCERTYKNVNGLKYHIEVASGSFGHAPSPAGGKKKETTMEKDRPYICQVPGCGKAYANSNGLVYHEKHFDHGRFVLRSTGSPMDSEMSADTER